MRRLWWLQGRKTANNLWSLQSLISETLYCGLFFVPARWNLDFLQGWAPDHYQTDDHYHLQKLEKFSTKSAEHNQKYKLSKLLKPWAMGCKDRPILPASSSDWRKGSINSSLADNRSETFAIHFSINSLTPGSFTFVNDAGLIPFGETTKLSRDLNQS